MAWLLIGSATLLWGIYACMSAARRPGANAIGYHALSMAFAVWAFAPLLILGVSRVSRGAIFVLTALAAGVALAAGAAALRGLSASPPVTEEPSPDSAPFEGPPEAAAPPPKLPRAQALAALALSALFLGGAIAGAVRGRDPSAWPTFEAPEGDFSIAFPGPPKPENLPNMERAFVFSRPGAKFMVGASGFDTYDVALADEVFDTMERDYQAKGWKIVERWPLGPTKSLGRGVRVETPNHLEMQGRFFLTPRLLYTLVVAFNPSKKEGDADARRFFDSFLVEEE